MRQKNDKTLLKSTAGVREIANSNNLKSIVAEVDQIADKLHSQSLYIVVLGLFKRGKSSIINALLDAEVAPVAITPLTSVVTFFKYAEEKRADIIFEDEKTISVSLHEIDEYVSEDLNPENIKKVREVVVYYPSDLLRILTLVDTPGLGSLYEHNSETTTSFIPKIDAALYVLSADLPISAADAGFLKNLTDTVPKLFFLLNKKDLLDAEGLKKLQDFNIKNIVQLTGLQERDLNFSCISAKQLTEAKNEEEKMDSGIPTLRQQLLDLTQSKGDELILESADKRLKGLIRQTEQLLKLRLAALYAPIKDIEEQTEKLRKSLDLIEGNQEDFLSVIKSRNKRIQEDVKSKVNQKSKELKSKYQELLSRENVMEISSNPSKSKVFINQLNTGTLAEYKQLHKEIETEVKSKFKEVMQGFINQSQHYLNELSVQLEIQFGLKIEMLIGKFDLDTYSPFYLRDIPEHNIAQPKAGLFSAFLPKKTIHKRFVKTVMTELDKMIVSNSSAMLYDINYRMDESLRKVNTDLNKNTHQIISQLLSVLSSGKEEKLNKEADVKMVIERLEEDIEAINQLK